MPVNQTIQFESTSLRQVGSGAITAFLFLDDVLSATLTGIAENATLDGRYTGVVTDKAAVNYRLVVRFNGYDDSDPDYQVTLLLAVGTYVAQRTALLDSAVADQITDIQEKVTSIDGRMQSILGNVVATIFNRTTDGFPRFLRKGDSRTVANAGAIYLRIYAQDDEEYTTPLLGVGSLLFTNATLIEFALMFVNNTTSPETVPEVQFEIEWEESGADGYFLIEYDADALDDATSFIAGINKFHEWGVKVSWATEENPITVAEGTTKVYNAIVVSA